MGNDRDDKFEGHEESEYHFSDEEANYEIETETPKQASDTGEPKESILARLTKSRRMLISLGVFLVLIFVVYKMIAPSSTVPSTNITTAPVVTQNMPTTTTPSAPVQTPPAAPQVVTAPVVPPIPGAMVQQTTAPVAAQPTTTPAPVPAISQTPNIPNSTAVVTPPMQQPAVSTQPIAQQPIQPPITQQPSVASQQQMVQPIVAQPQQIVTSPIPTYIETQPVAPVVTGGKIDQQTAVLASDADKLMAQLQTNYAQKLNEYNNQNKALQEQVQTLNSKVANIENQLNQLIHLLTRQQSSVAPVVQPVIQPVVQPQIAELPKVAYNVQAIIPGRAWLKSDSGETVTVAEGDVIKDMGRVTKIDPYDGLVEINTGNKVISLSYGNGG